MKQILFAFLLFVGLHQTYAQGPPITSDKAIMLSEGTFIIKTLNESLHTTSGNYYYAPLMVHYLPTSNSLVAVHIPYTSNDAESGLADIVVRAKYQIYRNDMKAKTHRLALKSVHWLPTGFDTEIDDYGLDSYQTQFTLISGYETLKYGIGAEVGYRYISGDRPDFWKADASFGLPLLKPTYPVNQVNLYFEYASEWYNNGEKLIQYAQGIQYAKDQVTFDLSIQIPLYESSGLVIDRQYKLLFGARYIW